MYLAAANDPLEALDLPVEAPSCPSARWENFPYSCLSHHGESCCDIAREWVLAMDFAQLNGGDLTTGPRWMRARWEWGPTAWPIHWCEAVEKKTLDCGAHAALAHEAFAARGLTAFRAQFVQRYSKDATEQWSCKWGADSVSEHWLGEDVIYHEGNALLMADDEVKLWDASAGWWINPRQTAGYGSLVAVRIFADGQFGGGDGLRWGEHRIKPNVWHQVG